MTLLVLGLAIFFAIHSVSMVNERWRNAMVQRVGLRQWRVVYSLISTIGLLLIVKGYGMARTAPVVVYMPPAWTMHLTALFMLAVFPLIISKYVPGRIRWGVKHPLLTATMIWALAHLLANGMLADVVLFGSFLVWAGLDRISMRRREQPVPILPLPKFNDAIAVGTGLVMYALFVLWVHQALFGVKPV